MILGCDTVTDHTPAKVCELDDVWDILGQSLTDEELEILDLKSWGYGTEEIAVKSGICKGIGLKEGIKRVYETLDKAKEILRRR